ncbi:unnamed protein product [Acanthoscelides obtectus]|uniref:Uncharacterized protein n=1 Tax=Acanthoscelides obtectus TaxID=200917 RepID=A0A9P0P5Y0_ACAOB|nr:unnamed protein product [Acanthoscelides obtectus]CAK1635286.1 hypothetical protein AOBTE_LOCUS9178 [Acanthoscelides obtectus]
MQKRHSALLTSQEWTERSPCINGVSSHLISVTAVRGQNQIIDHIIQDYLIRANNSHPDDFLFENPDSTETDEDPTYIPDTDISGDEGSLPKVEVPSNRKIVIVTDIVIKPGQKSEEKKKKKYIRQPDYCFFCDEDVLNFARHIKRNHIGESEVQNILSILVNSIDRKRCISNLRKMGNFIKNSSTFSKPVHKSAVNDSEENYMPCPFCLGFYTRKLLWKHKRICPLNKDPSKTVPLSEGQDLMLPKNIANSALKTIVFPRMLADKISLIAKKDALICAFGSRYINTHREQHHVNFCSKEMRELAKVLLECQKLDPAIKNLFDVLQPQHFDSVVQSVKVIARYNTQTDVFESPTFAMNISRSLKDCCDMAVLHIVKKKM